MEFRLLGPVQVWAAGGCLEMGPPQQRAVLAALAVDAGRPVFRGTLLDRIWSGRAPEGAASALYAHVNRIRRVLAAGAACEEPVRLARRSGGYVLEADPEDVDLHRFRQLALAARDRQRPDDERAKLLRAALEGLGGMLLKFRVKSGESRVISCQAVQAAIPARRVRSSMAAW